MLGIYLVLVFRYSTSIGVFLYAIFHIWYCQVKGVAFLVNIESKMSFGILALVFAMMLVAILGMEEKLIICAGDSITYGSGVRSAARNISSYPARLQEMLRQGNNGRWTVKNYGFRGAAATNKSRMSYETSLFFPEILRSYPNYVIFMLGTNDMMFNISVATFREDYDYMLTEVSKMLSKPKILLMLPPWLDLNYPTRAERFKYVKQDLYHKAIRNIANDRKLSLLNVYSIFENKPHLFADGLHPNEEGYNLIAKIVIQALETFGEIPSSQGTKVPTKESTTSKTKPIVTSNQDISLKENKFLGREAHFNKKGKRADLKGRNDGKKSSWIW